MSRYTTNKAGVTIGSDNVFFYHNAKGETLDFKCILSLKAYDFDQYSGANLTLKTPARQMVIAERPASEQDRVISRDDCQRIVYEVSSYFASWLDKNAPGWGVPPSCRPCDFAIFFKKRRHAVAFREEIMRHLKGMSIRH